MKIIITVGTTLIIIDTVIFTKVGTHKIAAHAHQ